MIERLIKLSVLTNLISVLILGITIHYLSLWFYTDNYCFSPQLYVFKEGIVWELNMALLQWITLFGKIWF